MSSNFNKQRHTPIVPQGEQCSVKNIDDKKTQQHNTLYPKLKGYARKLPY